MLDDAVTSPVTATLAPLGRKACSSTMLSAVLLLLLLRETRIKRAMTGAGAHMTPAETVATGEGVVDVDGTMAGGA